MDQGRLQLLLEPVGKKMGVLQGDGQHGAAAALQQPGVGQKPLIAALRIPAQDGGGAIGHTSVAEDQGGQVFLVAGGVGAVQDALVKILGGLGSMPPKMPRRCSLISPSPYWRRTSHIAALPLEDAQLVEEAPVGGIEQRIDGGAA